MRWEDGRESDNVEDVRGESGGGGFGGFGGGGGGLGGLLGLLPLLLGGGGGGLVILVIVGLLFFGGPILKSLGGGGGQRAPSGYQGDPRSAAGGRTAANDPQAQDVRFTRVVAAYTEDAWTEMFRERGATYTPAKFKVYSDAYTTACGQGSAEMGPFYCPGDRTVYLDLNFFRELSGKFGAPGRFAQAYVIAHEVGHHVQNLEGTMDRRERGGLAGSRNQQSVRTELQADCYAGVWANRANRDKQILEPGDLESGLKAATAVGDDTLQRQARGRVAPDSFTHGSSEQRVRWFRTGFDGGNPARCDTFSPSYGEL